MADTKQDIQKFFQVLRTRDFARDFQFRVTDIRDRGIALLTDDDLVYAKGGAVPGRTIGTIPVPYMGLQFRVPGAAAYPGSDAYTLEFYADSENLIRTVFERWSELTFDDATSTGNYRLFENSQVVLAQLNQKLEIVNEYKLIGVFPTEVGALTYSTVGGGESIAFTATLAYQYWRKNLG
tara:strand:- start:112 stop:651 length:540 start_codon:yes stop_codon:yes gene_type:complete